MLIPERRAVGAVDGLDAPLDRHRPIRRPAVRQLDRQAHARIVGERPNDHVLMAFHWLADFFELARIQQVNDTVNTVGDNLTKP